MMSNDSPKIDLPSLQLERVIKGSPDKKSQEEENLVCVASLESFLNGVTLHRNTKTGRSCMSYKLEYPHDGKNSDLLSETGITLNCPLTLKFQPHIVWKDTF